MTASLLVGEGLRNRSRFSVSYYPTCKDEAKCDCSRVQPMCSPVDDISFRSPCHAGCRGFNRTTRVRRKHTTHSFFLSNSKHKTCKTTLLVSNAFFLTAIHPVRVCAGCGRRRQHVRTRLRARAPLPEAGLQHVHRIPRLLLLHERVRCRDQTGSSDPAAQVCILQGVPKVFSHFWNLGSMQCDKSCVPFRFIRLDMRPFAIGLTSFVHNGLGKCAHFAFKWSETSRFLVINVEPAS